MAKKKNKNKKNQHNAGRHIAPVPGDMSLQDFAQTAFKKRASQYQKNGSAIDSVCEGLDFDSVRIKRRISSVLRIAEEIKIRYSDICPDSENVFSLAEDWVVMNTYPVSAFDHIEKYVCSTLGAAIWILDHIRDNGKTDKLNKILCNAPFPGTIHIPDVWDPCHSQQLLRQMVSIINSRNSDCSVTEKAVRKNKTTVARIYMDRPTAENKIDHNVPSRKLYDQVISLIDPEALSAIEDTYKDKYWDWLRRYFQCRGIFNQEEQTIRADIEKFQDQMQAMAAKNAVLSQNRKHISILSNGVTSGFVPESDAKPAPNQLIRAKTLEYQSIALYKKQEEFNERFNAFVREVGEFSIIPIESIANHYGDEIANIWKGFEIEDPYSMCMAFLTLLDQDSDLPWCYFPSVTLQSCYVSMLPWTRTRFIPNCDDIWEHYDSNVGDIVPGPSGQPLSKKIKVPDLDNWYRMQFHDTAKSNADDNNMFSLSHILYEVTGCLMPRKPERHLAALQTLNRYGINNKKMNQNLLYCMALLSEAKHQSVTSQFPISQESDFEQMPDTVDALQDQVIALREELSQCRQALQDATINSYAEANHTIQLQRQLSHRDFLLHDLSSIVFASKMPTIPHATGFPYRTASNYVVFSSDETWRQSMKSKLPDIQFFQEITKENTEILRSTDTVWIQPKDMSYDEYRRIIIETRKSDVPVRILPFTDVTSCATLLVQADISR